MIGIIRIQFNRMQRGKALRRRQHVLRSALPPGIMLPRVFCSLQRAGTAPRPRNCTYHAPTQVSSREHPLLMHTHGSREKHSRTKAPLSETRFPEEYLAHRKQPTPSDHHKSRGIGLLQVPTGRAVLLSEVPLYMKAKKCPASHPLG